MNVFDRCGLSLTSVDQLSGVAVDFNTTGHGFPRLRDPRLIDDINLTNCQSHGKPLFPVSLISKTVFSLEISRRIVRSTLS